MKEANVTNIGLHDRGFLMLTLHKRALTQSLAEREALRWVQKYISAFGGDPSKVMMYGFLSMFQ